MALLVGVGVTLSVDLDRNARVRTIEVQDVGADRMLPPELETLQPALA